MSGDEIIAVVVCGGIAAAGWGAWYFQSLRLTTLGGTHGDRLLMYGTPLVAMVMLYAVLRAFADVEVRHSTVYLTFYMLMGAAWLVLAGTVVPVLGVSPRDDALERRNSAAALVSGGAMIGFMFGFAGANIGDGPGWWVVVFSAALATIGLLLAWAIVEQLTHVSEAVTIDRDIAAGLRLGGFLIAAGLVFGRAAAGDWESFEATLVDFIASSWPVVGLVLFEVVVGLMTRPTPQQPHPPVIAFGLMPAAVYVGLAVLLVALLGPW